MRFVPPAQWVYRPSALQVEDRRGQGVHPAPESAKPPRAADLIQGTWSLVGLEHQRVLKITIKADKLIVMDKSEGKSQLDATARPRRLTVTVSDDQKGPATALAIHQLDGDDLKICMGRAGELQPPRDFNLKNATAGTFPTLWILKRNRPANRKYELEDIHRK